MRGGGGFHAWLTVFSCPPRAADQAAWDKTFPKSEKVEHRKVTFRNRYGITLSADLYQPKSRNRKLAAIAVSGPFGAVKEQSSGLYAQTMAERGFVTLTFDPWWPGAIRTRRQSSLIPLPLQESEMHTRTGFVGDPSCLSPSNPPRSPKLSPALNEQIPISRPHVRRHPVAQCH
jgi:hypothetical protein